MGAHGLERGASPAPEQGPAEVSAQDVSLQTILTTVRWVISAGAVVVASLAAGLQLRQLGSPAEASTWVAVGAYAVTVVTLGVTLRRAAEVLVLRGFTISDLASREVRALHEEVAGADPGDPLALRRSHERDPLLRELARRARELAPGRDGGLDIEHLYARHTALLRAWHELTTGGATTLDPRTYRAEKTADVAALRDQLADSQRAVDRLVAAAHLYEAQSRYAHLKTSMTIAGIALVVALPAFAVATGDPTHLTLKEPVAIRVVLQDDPTARAAAGIPEPCTAREVSGWALDGTYLEPEVVITTPGPCRGLRLHVTPAVGVAFPREGR